MPLECWLRGELKDLAGLPRTGGPLAELVDSSYARSVADAHQRATGTRREDCTVCYSSTTGSNVDVTGETQEGEFGRNERH
jgi:hypothetical protein